MAEKVKSGKMAHPRGVKTGGQSSTVKGPDYPESAYTPFNRGTAGDKGSKTVS